jgi:hypothetical protein
LGEKKLKGPSSRDRMYGLCVEYTEGDFLIELRFEVEGASPPSFRQLEALFERLDQAALIAIMALEPMSAEGESIDEDQRPRQAREFLQAYEGAPRVLEISTGSISVKVLIRDAKQAAAVLVAIGGVFTAGDIVVKQADHLVEDTATLVSTIENLGHEDARGARSQSVLAGQGADPAVTLSRADLMPFITS